MAFGVSSVPALVAALLIGPAAADRWRPPELRVRERAPVVAADELEALALQYLGRPYVMGGVGSPGFDCSGFVCRVYAEAGYALPRVSREQALAGRPVDPRGLLPGDLVFFTAEPGETRVAHVGIYLGDRELVHASTGQGGVVIADLGASWFTSRLVSARRVLPEAGAGPTLTSTRAVATSTAARPPLGGVELVEHVGPAELLPMLRLPARRPRPSFGPELASNGASALAVRAAVVTERGVLGAVLAPELELRLESIALSAVVAVPVRFELERPPTVGAVEGAVDLLRFLRAASLGLRGADLELRLGRLGDARLGAGLLVDRLAPAAAVSGVPGLVAGRSPLTFFGHLRVDGLEVEALADDAVDPGLLGLSLEVPAGGRLRAGLALATEQRAELAGARRALAAAEGSLAAPLWASSAWTVELGAGATLLRALGALGAEACGRLLAEHRWGSSAVRAELHGGWLGPRALAVPFGPTWAVAKGALLGALPDARGRATLGGELGLELGRVALGLAYADALGEARTPLDQRVHLYAELSGLRLGGTRVLGVRVAWAARAPLDGARRVAVLHAGARLRLASWAHAELYLERGAALEGGAGLALAFAP